MDMAAIAGIVAGFIGFMVGGGQNAEAQQLRAQIAAQYGDEILPMIDQQVAEQAGPSALAALQENPDARNRQVSIDEELANIYDTAGQTHEDQAAYNVARRNVAAQTKSRAASNAQQLAARGQAGGALSAVLAAESGQDETNALGAMDDNIASDSRGRALSALGMRASNANNIRGMDWTVGSGKASAMDLQNRFNASLRQQTNAFNAGIPQQNFNNHLAVSDRRGNALNGVALGMDASADRTRAAAGGIGAAAATWDWGEDDKAKKDKRQQQYDQNAEDDEYGY